MKPRHAIREAAKAPPKPQAGAGGSRPKTPAILPQDLGLWRGPGWARLPNLQSPTWC